ncbi:ABC transporter ATP-binding protein [Cupriavidus necator]
MTTRYILETRQLSKSFKGFAAVKNVDLAVRRGSIHALIGPNGAGKTTCFNLLTKFLTPTSGCILYNGEDITQRLPSEIARQGLVRSFQISAVFPHLTALENVTIAMQRKLGVTYHFWRTRQVLGSLQARALDTLDEVGLAGFANTPAVNLAYGRKRALEIATTLAMEPELMLLDEPTQGMGHEDIELVTQLIKRVAEGKTVLMVEHNMNVVSTIADRITVLQRGEILAEGSYEEVSTDYRVIEAYMGSSTATMTGEVA